MSEVSCPKCGTAVAELVTVDPGLIAKLKEEGTAESFPSQVCNSCYSAVAGSVARGSVLLAREKAKEKRKVMMWKSRVGLIKKARHYMTEKAFSDAAVTYEKYIKVLEVIFECKAGELTPEMFKDSARTQELTIVASVLWDLMRIYDTSEKYGDRMTQTATKLAQFLKFTPIYPDIMRKAESFQKNAKNPAVVKNFLKASGSDKGRCFIATSAYSTGLAPEVLALSAFRDQVLLKSWVGIAFVNTYYVISPPIARILDIYPAFKAPVRLILGILVKRIDRAQRQ